MRNRFSRAICIGYRMGPSKIKDYYYSTIMSFYHIERFSNDCRKTKPRQLLRPITTGAGSAMNRSQLLAITCNSLEAREK